MLGNQIQIESELFIKLYMYFFGEDAPRDDEADTIRKMMSDKIDKIVNRELYSRYKRAPTVEEREQARKAYLDSRGVPESFRW